MFKYPNNIRIPWLLAIIVSMGFISCKMQELSMVIPYQPDRNEIKLDGSFLEPAWQKAAMVEDFYVGAKKMSKDQTSLKIFQNDEDIFFGYELIESSHIFRSHEDPIESIALSDRVEIFIAKDTALSVYYGFELDLWDRYFDFEASAGKKINMDWKWPNEGFAYAIQNQGSKTQIEIRISKSSLELLDLIQKDNTLIIGFFRADFYNTKNWGDVHWISWQKLKSKKIDFHTPKAFGHIQL